MLYLRLGHQATTFCGTMARCVSSNYLADGVGFGPTRPLRACRFSRPVPSTARPPIQTLDLLCRRFATIGLFSASAATYSRANCCVEPSRLGLAPAPSSPLQL